MPDVTALPADTRGVVLVEGVSDQRAIQALARRHRLDLARDGVQVLPIGGATGIRRVLDALITQRPDVRLTGLCDAAEESWYRRGLAHAGISTGDTRADLEAVGFFVCVEDLEDELIRALGVPGVEAVVAASGQSGPLRTFRNQPAQRDRPEQVRLRRWIASGSGRKLHYAEAFVDALAPDRVPRPLDGVLAACTGRPSLPPIHG